MLPQAAERAPRRRVRIRDKVIAQIRSFPVYREIPIYIFCLSRIYYCLTADMGLFDRQFSKGTISVSDKKPWIRRKDSGANSWPYFLESSERDFPENICGAQGGEGQREAVDDFNRASNDSFGSWLGIRTEPVFGHPGARAHHPDIPPTLSQSHRSIYIYLHV
jgi:hypothetical protein